MPTPTTPKKQKNKRTIRKTSSPMPSHRIAAQLLLSYGNVSHAAKRLRLDRSALSTRISREPELQAVLEEAREVALDEAENALQISVRKREAWAVCFTLKTIGRSRGYYEQNPADRIPWELFTRELLQQVAAGIHPKTVLANSRSKVARA